MNKFHELYAIYSTLTLYGVYLYMRYTIVVIYMYIMVFYTRWNREVLLFTCKYCKAYPKPPGKCLSFGVNNY